MSTRNTAVFRELVDVLFTQVDEQTTALARLEHHFRDRLLVDAGDVVRSVPTPSNYGYGSRRTNAAPC